MAVEVEPRPGTTLGARRLLGVDAARGLALFGMMSVHVLPSTDAEGVTTAYLISSGRASALFAVLAGVGLALASGGTTPPRGRALVDAGRGVFGRAVALFVIGLALGPLQSGVAVILCSYAVLFLVAIPVLGLGPRALAALAVAAALLTPVLSQALRPGLGRPPGTNPDLDRLGDPVELLTTITATGYYPVLTWTTYLFAGLAVGRLALKRADVAAALLAGGLALALAATAVSGLLLRSGGRDALVEAGAGTAWIAGTPLDIALQTGLYGTTPTTTWWWLAVDAPHSGTTFDLAQTVGSALAVLGACLLLLGHAGRLVELALRPLAAAGSMTLTLYSLHVIALAAGWWAEDRAEQYLVHVVLALLLGTLWRTLIGRGPLEALATAAGRVLQSRPPDDGRSIDPRPTDPRPTDPRPTNPRSDGRLDAGPG